MKMMTSEANVVGIMMAIKVTTLMTVRMMMGVTVISEHDVLSQEHFVMFRCTCCCYLHLHYLMRSVP